MRKCWLFLLCVALVIPAFSVSCGRPAAQESISATCEDFDKQANMVKDVQITMGKTLTVSLCSNKTTGFSWPEKAQIGDPQVAEQTAYKWSAPESSGKVGVPGTEVYTFRALQPGTSVISLAYSQPWAGGQKNARTFKINLTVK